MATLATFFKKSDALWMGQTREVPVARHRSAPLRALPNEDIYFFVKRIDNSRLVREADPRARGECWSAIAAACVLAVVLISMLAPGVAGIIAGYQVQALKQEEQRLVSERRGLEVEEARLLSPQRLEKLARDQKLVNPVPGQVVHLNPKGEGSVAANHFKKRKYRQ
jgi:hypothetical protein